MRKNYQRKERKSNRKFEIVRGQELLVWVPLPMSEVEKSRDNFWRDHLSGIIGRGVEQGVFRQDIKVEATVTALMAQFKGIGFHATLGNPKRDEVDQAMTEIERQIEHWLGCRSI